MVDQLRSKVNTENLLRQAAEDKHDTNLVVLKLGMANQAFTAKAKQEELQKELVKVKYQQEKERQTFETVIKKRKAAHDAVVQKNQHRSKETTTLSNSICYKTWTKPSTRKKSGVFWTSWHGLEARTRKNLIIK